jgi:hypothetical protein
MFIIKYQNTITQVVRDSYVLAAENGEIDEINRLHISDTQGDFSYAAIQAARYGNLDIVQWFVKYKRNNCTKNMMDIAAKYGHLNVVSWMHYNTDIGCTVNAMTSAAENGNLDVVEFLYSKRLEGCIEYSLNRCLSNGYYDTALFLKDNIFCKKIKK